VVLLLIFAATYGAVTLGLRIPDAVSLVARVRRGRGTVAQGRPS